MLHVHYAAFEQLFHRVDAIVHHGGIGTFAEALRAGKPQIIKPMCWDQFDNGALAQSMGVGETIVPEQFNAEVLAASLERLLSSAHVARACSVFKQKVDAHNGILAAVQFLEQIDLKTLQLTSF
jgi:UDP:flavonoid glycosyltransferase YjiC (YdhE family)